MFPLESKRKGELHVLGKSDPQAQDPVMLERLEFREQMLDVSIEHPILVVQSPKTPTMTRKLKAVSLDSEQQEEKQRLQVNRNVFSMPNTPKKQQLKECDGEGPHRVLGTNLKKFASNSSISGSQTLKTLPEIKMLHDFSDEHKRTETPAIKLNRSKGLLERRGSNASLTIDLGAAAGEKPRLNTAKSISNLNLTSFGGNHCECKRNNNNIAQKTKDTKDPCTLDRRKSQTHLETCGNCTIYEFVPSKFPICKSNKSKSNTKCTCICNIKCNRKSLSNENLYVPPCGMCQNSPKCLSSKQCKGHRRACYPRQADLEASQLLSEDFKMHLQNVQYLQTAGNLITKANLRTHCERVPKLHQEFWEVPLNLQEKCLVSGSQTRNRYRGVLPNEHSRVHLSEDQPYIHANFIKGPDYTETAYIATQGPMVHTCQDFWQMVWQTDCKCIVMLTQLVEKGRNKCDLYFPLGKSTSSSSDANTKSFYNIKSTRVQDKFTFESAVRQEHEIEIFRYEEVNQVTYGDFEITFTGKQSLGDCIVRRFILTRKNSKESPRHIKHYWYANWQDHKMADPNQVLNIAQNVLAYIDKEKQKVRSGKSMPLLVCHCSAGIGRTGCFLAVLNGMQQLRNNTSVDVLAILCSLRLHRGGMVQTAEQYVLIHRVLSLFADTLFLVK